MKRLLQNCMNGNTNIPGVLKIVSLNFARDVFMMDNVQMNIANFFMFARHIVSSLVEKLYSS